MEETPAASALPTLPVTQERGMNGAVTGHVIGGMMGGATAGMTTGMIGMAEWLKV